MRLLEGPWPGFRSVNKPVARQCDVDVIRTVCKVSRGAGGVRGGTQGLEKGSEMSMAAADAEKFTS